MKIFKDKNLTQEAEFTLDFDVVQAGTIKEVKYYIFNDELADLEDIEFSVTHKEVKVVEAPTELPPKGVGELVLRWDAKIELERGLKGTKILVKAQRLFE